MQAPPAAISVGPEPAFVTCPNCRNQIRTKMKSEASSKAYICCGLLMLFGCCLCCWVPFCMDKFHNVVHRCPKCNAFIGQYSA